MKNLKSDIKKRIQSFSSEEIIALSVERKGEMSNFIKGIINKCFGVNFKSFDEIVFEYFNYNKKFKGYALTLSFKEKDFYPILSNYIYFLSQIFSNLEAVELYNTYINIYRNLLEQNSITTISSEEYNALKTKNKLLILAGDYEVVHYIDEVKFYRFILGFSDKDLMSNTKQVYLIYSTSRRIFKIGRSKNPESRILQGKTFDPNIVIIKIWKGHSILEMRLKNYFSKKTKEENGLN